ncbi:kinesin-like protein KIN-7F isoform X1 [Zingiber officinale]|uniref:kinesin-like protein KIN-7F isoform X1 n=1 Tax=Zingiber officinale TaxID=94328 RepID=UPI001C4C7887|nr:kinesin-like protein KIN-7F isoform X1 [Zingiber officinale]
MGAVGAEELIGREKVESASGDGGNGKAEKIFVSVRLRPLSEKEMASNDPCDWECINDTTVIFRSSLPERSMSPTAYTFDRVFQSDHTTKQVYQAGAKDVALSVVSGVNSAIFAYGQTSSGKTYTMTGITEYAAQDIYEYIHKHDERAYVLKFSAVEIYNEAVKDLLSTDSSPLRLLDDPEKGTVIEKLSEEILTDWNHLKALISVCEAHRKIGETSLNETSSRSHQILRLTIESCAREFLGKDNSSTLVASVNFVDLAGSERASQALSSGTRLEGYHINRSLLTLGSVIRKLSKGRNGYIPYRDSKLTRILQPSLGGNARTAIICTISPARSHIEQSRHTLQFASCAKEVVTSAQVNIVMSDKALVKHLEEELARLENELRYPGISPTVETMLREKDLKIQKMENEINKLIQQLDIAHSQLENSPQVIGKDPSSRPWEEPSSTSPLNGHYVGHYLPPMSEPSDSTDLCTVSATSRFVASYNQSCLQTGNYTNPSPRHLGQNHKFIESNGNQGGQWIGENFNDEFEQLYQDVHCIEVNGAHMSEDSESILTEGSNSLQRLSVTTPEHIYGNCEPERQRDLDFMNANPVTLEQHLQNVKKTLSSFVEAHPNRFHPCSTLQDPRSKDVPLSRSISCRSTLMSSPTWLKVDNTSPTISLDGFHGRPEELQKKGFAWNFRDTIRKLSARGSQNSGDSTSFSVQKLLNTEATSSGKMDRSVDYTELNEMVQVDEQKQSTIDQDTGKNVFQELGAKDTAKYVGQKSTLDSLQPPTLWPREFEKNQQEIIQLWHECHVSLIHRTCFYMLFKGDPTDSIYMEVELRRLSFLKSTVSRQHIDKASTVGQHFTSAPSLRLLRRERDMLCRQMEKNLSGAERESLYAKWGIELDSKQRRLQLAQCLWSEPNDIEHVRESAAVVASLIGLLEQGRALKEMFGLAFSPQKSSKRSSWKYGLSYR